jgi:hypothetical protein
VQFGFAQKTHGQAGIAIGSAVETGEVIADDFGGVITLQSPGAGVPRRYVSLGIEPDDCVVNNAVDEKAEVNFRAFDTTRRRGF